MRGAVEIAIVSLLYVVAAAAADALVVAAHACRAGDAGCLAYRHFLAWSFVAVDIAGYAFFIARYARARRLAAAGR